MQMDRPVVLIQFGIPLVGQRTMKTVPAAKSSPQRPDVLWPASTVMCEIGKRPLDDRVGAIPIGAEHLWDDSRLRGDLPSVSGKAAWPFGDNRHSHGMRVALGKQACAGRLAHVGDVQIRIPPPTSRK